MRVRHGASARTVHAQPKVNDMTEIVEQYVKLVLAMGLHDPAFVDAYYGPPEWRAEMGREKLTPAAIPC